MAAPTTGRTLLVANRPGTYPSIGHALAEASPGAVISIASGTYVETVELAGAQVTLAAADGAQVIIDGHSAEIPVLLARGGSVVLQGIELRAGGAPAIVAQDAALTVQRCTIIGGRGPAISIRGREPFEVSRCSISAAEQGVVVDGVVRAARGHHDLGRHR